MDSKNGLMTLPIDLNNESVLHRYLEKLDNKGLIEVIEESVHPVFGVGYFLNKYDNKKAVLFMDVVGTEHPLIGNLCCSRELLAESLGVTVPEIHLHLQQAINHRSPPEIVADAPFLEVERDINLYDFAIPKFYRGDAGIYLSSSIFYANNPVGSGLNSSIHRVLVTSKYGGPARIVPRDLYTYYEFAKEEGKDLPIALVTGVHPAVIIGASTPLPLNDSEMQITNELLKPDFSLTPTPKYGIPVPTHAEVVMEGVLKTNELDDEGPFVDVSGTLDEVRKQPVVSLERMYYRKNPIFQTILPARTEHYILMGFGREVKIREYVLNTVPHVRGIHMTPGGNAWLHAVISVKKRKNGDAKNAIFAAFAAHPSLKWVTAVDEDIDPYDPLQVEWATITRTGEDDIIIVRKARGSSLDNAGDQNLLYTQKVGIDATRDLTKPYSIFEKAHVPDISSKEGEKDTEDSDPYLNNIPEHLR